MAAKDPLREILIIARQFPPYEQQGAVVRIIKFCKYLPRFGFKPVVVTVSREPGGNAPSREHPLLREIEESAEVIHVPETRWTYWLERVTERKKELQAMRGKTLGLRIVYAWYALLKGIVSNLHRPVRKRLLAPDEGILWNRRARKVCSDLIGTRGIRFLLTTSPQNSTHVLGWELKREHDLVWCADFRDAWLGNPLFRSRHPRRNAREERMGRGVLELADVVTTVNEPILELIRRYATTDDGPHLEVIYNGFDPEEIPREPHAFDPERLHILHCGVITPSRDLSTLLSTVEKMDQAGKPCRVHLVGSVTDPACTRFQERRPDLLCLPGVLPRVETMRRLRGADVALMIFPAGNYAALSGKIFEYLGCDRPVIGLVPEGIAREFVAEHGMGWCCDMHDADAIEAILDRVHERWTAGTLTVRYPDEIKARFDRRAQTGRLAALLEGTAGRRAAGLR